MAIAYFIPDQAKLLAGGGRANRQTTNNQRNAATPPPPPRHSHNVTSEPNPAVNRGYGTTINLTVPNYATAQEPSGCWDFLTQVFCHALRFYHESSQLQPTVVQISVNFQSQTPENPTATENSTAGGNSNITAQTPEATAAAQQNTTTDTFQTASNPTGASTEGSSAATNNSATARNGQDDGQPLKNKNNRRRKM